MSEGSTRADHLMAPLSLLGAVRLGAEHYNRIYEAVGELSETRATKLVAAVQAAILAERERCAKVAESFCLSKPDHTYELRKIAAAIRSGKEPT
jgi:hypothetical protein